MKKIPTLFQREFDHHRVVNINPVAPPELQWVLDGEGIATEKVDGACCAIINGTFYNRYDAKKDKRGRMKLPPEGAIPCDVPDPVTGHWPHWVKVEESDPADRWFVEAYKRAAEKAGTLADGTYEAIGPHFQSNPYHLAEDVLVRHGAIEIDLPDRSFEGIRDYLERHAIEGIVFWKDGKPRCKIKRKDFGFKWPCDGVGKDIDKAEVISRTADGDRVNQEERSVENCIRLKLCDVQGRLFKLSIAYASENFIRNFMLSEVARHLDSPYSKLQCVGEEYLLEELEDERKLSTVGETYDPKVLYWIGYLYRYWACYRNESSKAIYKIAPARTMKRNYMSFHTLDPNMAIDNLIEIREQRVRGKGTP